MKRRKSHRSKKTKKGIFKKKSLYGTVFAIVIFSIAFLYCSQHPSPNQTTSQTFQLKAAIVDHLSLSAPNQTFIQTAINTLKQANYSVDYYPGEEVTVNFYRNLPTNGYSLIILRVHSFAFMLEGKELVECPVGLFSSESYSKTKYVHEQLTDQLLLASYNLPKPPYYFAIIPKFVTHSMNGEFDNTAIIMMGCEGLTNSLMAEALLEKGAKVYISWNGSVSASHTDQATTQLLKHLLTEKQTIKQAVTETTKEVGPDPSYKSQLIYYPLEVRDQTIEDVTGNQKTNP